jgi:N,N'-diacetyllegionaminate synthase
VAAFIIAEAGVNHNGDLGRALEMVEVAACIGADAVKFQSFLTEKVMTRSAEKAEYQKRQTGAGSQFDMVKKLELDAEAHHLLAERCNRVGVEFMSTAFDVDSHKLLCRLGVRRIKVPSGEITNWPFLRALLADDLPIILSTGMATLDEIVDTVEFIKVVREANGFDTQLAERLTILHCTSNYPADFCDVNLRAMRTIAESTGLPVGYSDHTLGTAVATAAVAMGAEIIEKHFTLDRGLPGPDHMASIEPNEFKFMVSQIRTVEAALGSDQKVPAPCELGVRAVARRSITSARDLVAGSILQPDDLAMMRPGTGISPRMLDDVVGRTLQVEVPEGTLLDWTMLS